MSLAEVRVKIAEVKKQLDPEPRILRFDHTIGLLADALEELAKIIEEHLDRPALEASKYGTVGRTGPR